MEPDELTELGEPEPITDANYRDGWDSVATDGSDQTRTDPDLGGLPDRPSGPRPRGVGYPPAQT